MPVIYINKYASGPLDVTSAREYLKQLQETDAMFRQVIEKVGKSTNDICARVNATHDDVKSVSQQMTELEKTLIEKLEKLDKGTCSKKVKVGMHVELMLGGPSERWICLMERTLNDIFNEAYKTSGEEFEEVEKRVGELLEDIKQNSSVKFKGSKTMCIILTFECVTLAGLLDFLRYVTSRKYRLRLDALSEALSKHFRISDPVHISSKIPLECLQNVVDLLAEEDVYQKESDNGQSRPTKEYKKSLRLAMECSSVEDLLYLWKMFQQGGAAHYLDRIAEILSKHSGQKITLSSSIDLEELKEALEDTVGGNIDAAYNMSVSKGIKERRQELGHEDTEKVPEIPASSLDIGYDDFSKPKAEGSKKDTRTSAEYQNVNVAARLRNIGISLSKKVGLTGNKRNIQFCSYEGTSQQKTAMIPSQKFEFKDVVSMESSYEKIQGVYIYKYPLTAISFLDPVLYHMVVVFETVHWWWSIERSLDGITLQRSKTSDTVLNLYRATSRKYEKSLERRTKGHSNVRDLIYWLDETGELDKGYNVLTSNCTTFANCVLYFLTAPKSPTPTPTPPFMYADNSEKSLRSCHQ